MESEPMQVSPSEDAAPATAPLRNVDMTEESDYVQPVALLMDDLKSEDTAVRVESMRRLRIIAVALGPERTRSELLPFLLNSLDEEDEVLSTLADELGQFVEHVGGSAFAYALFPLFEGLVSAEEPFVRNKALTSFEAILSGMTVDTQLVDTLLALIQRLAAGDWFPKKNSAASLCVTLYSLLSASSVAKKDELLADLVRTFVSLGTDETPLVRKAVATCAVRLVPLLPSQAASEEFLSLILQLSHDPQDSVRMLTVEPFALLLHQHEITPDSFKDRLLPIFVNLASDHSWRIRFMVALHFGQLTQAVQKLSSAVDPPPDTLQMYCALLRDVESEVRTAAASQAAIVSECFSPELVDEHIISTLNLLSGDASSHVRSAVALRLNDLARVVGKEMALRLILPLILQLLRDDSSEVRLNVISRLEIIVSVIGMEQLSSSLLPAIVALSEDRQWRVRQTIIEYIPELALHLGQEFFDQQLSGMLQNWLCDPVFAVRETTIDSIKRLIRQFGSEWSLSTGLLDHLVELRSHRNYLRRLTLLFALSSLCSVVTPAVVGTVFLPILQQLGSDPVANVRLNVAKTIEAILPVLLAAATKEAAINETVALSATLLRQLDHDADADVQFFAQRALHLVPVL